MNATRERRHNTRKDVAVSVYLAGAGQRFRRCRVRDLSVRGVFVETPTMVMPGSTVDLVFALDLGRITKTHHLSAKVVRIARNGAGMVFCPRRYVPRAIRP